MNNGPSEGVARTPCTATGWEKGEENGEETISASEESGKREDLCFTAQQGHVDHLAGEEVMRLLEEGNR